MGRVILCETTVATTSYVFPNTRVEVFSYEELCYYIYNNIALLEEEYFSNTMFNWIENFLKLPELANILRQKKERENDTFTDLLTAILVFKDYYTTSEVKTFIGQMERMNGMNELQYRKLQGDGFLRYHKYMKAVAIYDEILDQNPEMRNNNLKASIYHNKAVALANNFELEKAMDCYYKAYDISKNPASIYQYMLLLATMKNRGDVEVVAKYHGVEDILEKIYDAIEDAETDVKGSPIYHRMEKAMFHYEKNNLSDFSKRMDTVIEQLKAGFREQTV